MVDMVDEVTDWNYDAENEACGDVLVDLIELVIVKVLETLKFT